MSTFKHTKPILIMATSKPKVMAISSPRWAGEDYMKEFEAKFDLHVSPCENERR